MVAWDPVTQTERWRVADGGSTGGGTVTTAGNLVFQVVPDGRLVAYSADKGQKLLEIQTGLRGGMGPPITYEIDGIQYVALMGGLGRNNAPSAEAAAANPDAAVSGNRPLPRLMVFVLGGAARRCSWDGSSEVVVRSVHARELSGPFGSSKGPP